MSRWSPPPRQVRVIAVGPWLKATWPPTMLHGMPLLRENRSRMVLDYTIIIYSYEDYVLFHVPCFCVVVNKNSNMISFFY